MNWLAWLGIFSGTSLLVALFLNGQPREKDVLKKRLDQVKQRVSKINEIPVEKEPVPAKKTPVVKKVLQRIDRIFIGQYWARYLALRLMRADLKLTAVEFALIDLGAGLVGWLGGTLLSKSALVSVLFMSIGLGLPFYYLSFREGQRLKAFNHQLPDALDLISNSLKTGYSFLQALDLVAGEMPPPISKEFELVLKETRFNISVEDALNNLLQRVGSPDLDLVVTAVLIQRQVGGNLADVLDKIGSTIRDRIRILGEIRTLTAQGRMSGWIISLLPVALALFVFLINPDYIKPLFTSILGKSLLILAALMQFIGIFIIRKVVNIDV